MSPAPVYDNSFAKGTVIDSVVCANAGDQSYALYLPTYYDTSKPFPCIFFYDAHARGAKPIRAYKDLAEKYGFILAGSNISKNGIAWDITHDVARTMMQDVQNRLRIDPARVYTSGFSGGSRVASLIAINDGGVAGVIGCSAGFPDVKQAVQPTFSYVGIVGTYDFNLAEMEHLDEQLQQNGFAHQLFTFDGIHKWPPAAEFEAALLWIQVNAIKKHIQPSNDTLVSAFKNDIDKRIAGAKAGNELIKEEQLLNGAVITLTGIADASSYNEQLKVLVNSASYKQAVRSQDVLQQQETALQQELAGQFPTQGVQWWKAKIAELNRSVQTAATKLTAQMYRRVLSYLGLMGYMYTDHALKTGDLTNAKNYLEIFKMADSKNPDCSYLKAIYFMKQGNKPQAIAALIDAASSGYDDLPQLLTDTAFQPLYNDVGFIKAENKIKENYRG